MTFKRNPFNYLINAIKYGMKGFAQSISEVNNKYKEPFIKPTPITSIVLFGLKLYLIGMLSLILIKFIGSVYK